MHRQPVAPWPLQKLGLHGIEMLIFGDSRLAVDVFPTRVILQLRSKLLLHLQELPHHLGLGDHKLLLDGHVGRGAEHRSRSHQSHWEKHEFVPPSEIHEIFISHILASLFMLSTRGICRMKLIAPIGEKLDSTTELLENS
jgi:hypothetical protein